MLGGSLHNHGHILQNTYNIKNVDIQNLDANYFENLKLFKNIFKILKNRLCPATKVRLLNIFIESQFSSSARGESPDHIIHNYEHCGSVRLVFNKVFGYKSNKVAEVVLVVVVMNRP